MRPSLTVLLVLLPLLAAAADVGQIQQRLDHADVIGGRFTQSRELPMLPQPLLSQGRYLFVAGTGLYWQVQAPVASELRIRDGRMQERYPGSRWQEAGLGDAAGAQVGRILAALMSGDLPALRSVFDSEDIRVDESGWQVRLVPRDAAVLAVMSGVRLSGDRYVREVDVDAARGGVTHIELQPADDPEALADARRQLADD